jgi:1-acyl-sn-glycerol-3-phosphate acyltransferase
MGVVANHTSSNPDGSMNIYAIKKHLFYFMATVTLLTLGKFELKSMIGCMGIVANCTSTRCYRPMNVQLREIVFAVTFITEVSARFFQFIIVVRRMGVVAARASALLNGFVHVGLFIQRLCLLVAKIA